MMMVNFRNGMAALAVAVAFAAAVSPAMAAQKRAPATQPGYAARAQALPGQDSSSEGAMTPDRDAAIRDCSGKANALGQTTWGNTQGTMFRTCMNAHGQPE